MACIDELEKQLFIKLFKWSNKKCKNFNICNVVFFIKKKIKKSTWRYNYFTTLHKTSWWYDLQFLRYRVWQTEIGNYGPFFVLLHPPPPSIPKSQKIKILKKQKNLPEISLTHMNQKSWSYDVCFLRYGVQQTQRQVKRYYLCSYTIQS